MPGPSRWKAGLRHARHYAHIFKYADAQYEQGGANTQTGLLLFDEERPQIATGWAWAEAQFEAGMSGVAALICTFANATLYIDNLRHDIQRERIPQLELARLAAQRLGQKRTEGTFLGALGQAYADLGQFSHAIDCYKVQLG
jgi:DNA-binding IclR family transcriptional regulator